MEPKVLYEDNQVIVIDKPAGMVVNRAESVVGETVQDWAENYLKILSTKLGKARPFGCEILNKSQIQNSKAPKSLEFRNSNLEFSRRSGIVHRIDKETSGVLIIAKTPEAFEELQRQFKDREIEKKYIALVHGRVVPEEGTIKADVARLPWNRERFGVLPGGRAAETYYKVESYYLLTTNPYSLLSLYPKTGRTHQIRVHLKSLGHPIVSDPLYAGRKTARRDREWCPRLFLHASSISFTHPKTKEKITVKSELPKDLKGALRSSAGPAARQPQRHSAR